MLCEYVEVVCTNGCKKMILRSNLPHHRMTECKFQLEECELCKGQVKRIEMQVCLFILYSVIYCISVVCVLARHIWRPCVRNNLFVVQTTASQVSEC